MIWNDGDVMIGMLWNDEDVGVDVDKYPLCMEVLHGLGDGVEHGAGLPLREELLSEDFIQQLPSFKQLRHQENRAAVVIHLQNTETNFTTASSARIFHYSSYLT